MCIELNRVCVRVCVCVCVCVYVCVYVVDGAASVCLAETLDPGMLETGADWSILWRL